MLNIVIPMAGAGSRFFEAGYEHPKPLIDVAGRAMIEIVINNLKPNCAHKFIFICQKKHVEKYGLKKKLSNWAPGCEVVEIEGLTDGAARTVLSAMDLINNSSPLMIANSDQYIDIDINEYLNSRDSSEFDGLIMTMTANDKKWSYVGFNDDGVITKVIEKKVISSEATVGIYNFSRGKDFVESALEMIENQDMSNGEYYVAPVYNYMINRGAKLTTFNIGEEAKGMYGLGIPSDLDLFLSLPIHKKAVCF